ncbi:hypothetical protein [Pseudolysinimonas sp.]|uniref:hypothetical protein n=1 Tax=Pseudolysinimonas sp. TaxID=2680009 RepID=UPI003F810DE2
MPRLSRRARVLGSAGVLVAAAAMATLGFTAGHAAGASDRPQLAAPSPAASTTQLTTLSLSEVRGHKPLP